MNMLKRLAFFAMVGVIVVSGSEIGERSAIPGVHSVIPTAEAVVGRPLTPVSVAGVARREDRRD
jgi:hypothetical protein